MLNFLLMLYLAITAVITISYALTDVNECMKDPFQILVVMVIWPILLVKELISWLRK